MKALRNTVTSIVVLLCVASSAMAVAEGTTAAGTYYLFVLNEAAPGLEDEFNRWYDQQHAQDVLVNPDYLDSQRYVASERQLRAGAKVPTKYAIKFRIVTQDIARSLQYIHDNIRSGRTVPTQSIARGAGTGGDFVYKAIGSVMPGRATAIKSSGKAASANYLYVVFSTAAAGKQQQFNDWYNNVHAQKVAALAGVIRWQRFELSPVQLTPRRIPDVEQYMAMYDLEGGDPAMVDRLQREIQALEGEGPGDAGTIGASYTYRVLGPLLLGDDVKRERRQQSH